MTTVLQISTMVPPTGFGGAERVVSWLADRLRAAGHQVHNAGLRAHDDPAHDGTTPIRNLYWPFDGQRHGALARSAWHAVDSLLLPARRDVQRLFDRVDPAVVVTHNLRGWGLAPWVVAQERDVPLVHVVHDYGLACNPGTLWKGTPCASLCASCRPRASTTVHRWPGGQVVGVSQAVLDAQADRGVVLAGPTGVAYPLAAAAPTRPRHRAGVGVQPPGVVGFLGRLTPAKGLELLLQAVAGAPVQLLVAGSGATAYEDGLRRSAPSNVTWCGWLDPAELFERIDLLVVPSVWPEPFGLVVVEAANAGVPVLVADHPGLVEAARASQALTRTFAAGAVDSLRDALGRPVADYRTLDRPTSVVDLVALISRCARATSDPRTDPGAPEEEERLR